MNSLKMNCFQQMKKQKTSHYREVLPAHLYEDYVAHLQIESFPVWTRKIKVVNLELNIQDMDVNQDMFLDELTHHIYIKKKIKDEEDEENDMMAEAQMEVDGEEQDDEYELYHEFHDETGLYPAYYQIAKARQYIE